MDNEKNINIIFSSMSSNMNTFDNNLDTIDVL